MAAQTVSIRRKVLQRDDFGLCVLWPKSHWGAVGPPGGTVSVQVDGSPRRVRVEAEDCDCRGMGRHQHWFLCIPKASNVTAGRVVTVQVGEGEL